MFFGQKSSKSVTVALDWGKKRVKSCSMRRTVLQSTVYRANTGLKPRPVCRVRKYLDSKKVIFETYRLESEINVELFINSLIFFERLFG